MTTLIILIVLTAVGIILAVKSDYCSNFEILGLLISIMFGALLIIHIIVFAHASYGYKIFIAERDAFEQTLKVSRECKNNYEKAAIIKDVACWNMRLAKYKYQNKTIFYGQYIDDRIELLEPIK